MKFQINKNVQTAFVLFCLLVTSLIFSNRLFGSSLFVTNSSSLHDISPLGVHCFIHTGVRWFLGMADSLNQLMFVPHLDFSIEEHAASLGHSLIFSFSVLQSLYQPHFLGYIYDNRVFPWINSSLVSSIPTVLQNDDEVMYVESDGENTSNCGLTTASACQNLAFAYFFGHNAAGILKTIVLGEDKFTETVGIIVTGTLRLSGENQTESSVAKGNDSTFCLFTIEAANAVLSVSNLSFLLTTHTDDYNYVRSANGNTTVFVRISSCRFTMDIGLTNVYGRAIYVDNSQASVSLDRCVVYRGSTTAGGLLLYIDWINDLLVNESSFSDVNSSETGGCFRIGYANNFTLSRCLFTQCRGEQGRAVGFVNCLAETSGVVRGCFFWNITGISGNYGVMFLQSSSVYRTPCSITNSSFLRCSSNSLGCFALTNYLVPTLNRCSFVYCVLTSTSASSSRGGALLASNCNVSIYRSTFIYCSARNGGAIGCLNPTRLSFVDCIFINNSASRYGKDVWLQAGSATVVVEKTRTYSDSSKTINKEEESDCGVVSPDYCQTQANFTTSSLSTSTCTNAFSADDQNPTCATPCAGNGVSCADVCPSGTVPIGGACVSWCVFWQPRTALVDDMPVSICDSPCSRDAFLGAAVCVGDCYEGVSDANPTAPSTENSSLTERICRPRTCSERTPHPETNTPCGDNENCFYISEEGRCASVCPGESHYYGSPLNGKCVIKGCDSRVYNSTALYVCGPDTCYYDIVSQHCSDTCSVANHFVVNPLNKMCELLDCPLRSQNVSTQYPCGSSTCFYDGDVGQCTSTCSREGHYGGDYTTGECKLRECSTRILNDSALYPCGSDDCFYDEQSQQCVDSCPASHTTAGAGTWRCGLKLCNERTLNSSATYPCGSNDCYYNPDLQKCAFTCESSNHYSENSNSGYCDLKECNTRSLNESALLPCGSSCYYDNSSSNCTSTCASFSHFTGSSTTGYCELRLCTSRSLNTSADFPCGSDCYYDSLRNQCAVSCSVPGHYTPDIVTLRCEPKVCEDRTLDNSTLCGSGCFYREVSEFDGSAQCVSACVADDLQTGGDNQWSCELKPCESRVQQEGWAVYPCGPNCFKSDTGSFVGCKVECAEPSIHKKDMKKGVCTMKSCQEVNDEESCKAISCSYSVSSGCSSEGSEKKESNVGLIIGIIIIVVVAVVSSVVSIYCCYRCCRVSTNSSNNIPSSTPATIPTSSSQKMLLPPGTIELVTIYNPLASLGIPSRDVTGLKIDLRVIYSKLDSRTHRLLYHGTKSEYAEMIRQQDYFKPSDLTQHGQDLGPGVYFGDSLVIAKYWADGAGGNSDEYFQCIVYVGNVYEINLPGVPKWGHDYDEWQDLPQKYDSIHCTRQWAVRSNKNILAYALWKTFGKLPPNTEERGRVEVVFKV